MILVAVFVHREQGRSCRRLNADNALPVPDVGGLAVYPVPESIKQLVSFKPFVVAVPRLHTVDDLELVFRLISTENVFFDNVRRLNRRQRHRRSIGGKKFEPNQINRLVRERV